VIWKWEVKSHDDAVHEAPEGRHDVGEPDCQQPSDDHPDQCADNDVSGIMIAAVDPGIRQNQCDHQSKDAKAAVLKKQHDGNRKRRRCMVAGEGGVWAMGQQRMDRGGMSHEWAITLPEMNNDLVDEQRQPSRDLSGLTHALDQLQIDA